MSSIPRWKNPETGWKFKTLEALRKAEVKTAAENPRSG